MTPRDKRRLAARPDLAAASLRGIVEAARYVEGTSRRVVETASPLRDQPAPDLGLSTEAVYGERVTVFEEREGWAWGQLERDGYVGWLSANALGALQEPTHRIAALRTFIYPTPSIKTPPIMPLTLGSEITVARQEGAFLALADVGFVFARHAVPASTVENDPLAVARLFVGVPYLWGGKTSLGLDCSGLVQTAMQACGIACPRDSDMQAGELGESIVVGPNLEGAQPGDLVFWKGHVAFVGGTDHILHATGHAMSVVEEDLAAALVRIGREAGPPIAVRRVGHAGVSR